MNGADRLFKALEILGASKPDTLFVAADVRTEYVLFLTAENRPELDMELKQLGCYYVAKYEMYGLEREILWDSRDD